VSIDLIMIVLACVVGFVMSWGVGANDLANIMSTTMGSKAITVRQAIVIAIIFELAGALLGGADVTNTIRTGIINIAELPSVDCFIYGMLATLLAGSVWIWTASFIGMPVSITNAIVGSMVGFGAISLGMNAVHWHKVTLIAISWVSSPLIAGAVAFFLFNAIRASVLSRLYPVKQVKKWAPVYLFIVGVVLSEMVVIKGLDHFGVSISIYQDCAIDVVVSVLVVLFGLLVLRRIVVTDKSSHDQLVYVEKVFSVLMALTACAMVFAHGSNDVAISVGPIAAIMGVVSHGEDLTASSPIPVWVILLGCTGVILGFIVYGRKVIETVGSGITALTPSRAFAATLSAATTVVVATSTGIPVSATQTLVGAVLGVGLARGIGALNITVVRNIFLSWVVTLPVAALLSVLFYDLIEYIAS
jgi:PiT family inorganic phosphate transporter